VAKGKKDADRRAVVEQMRREQKRKERRKSLLILGAAVTVGAIIIGYAVWAAVQESETDGRDLASIGVAASEAGCQEVTTAKAEGNNDHRAEGEDIAYDQSPPAAGPHWGQFLTGNQIRKFWTTDDRPPVERLVHSLEHGHTILWYDETIADDEQALEELRSIAGKFPSNTDFSDKFMAAPWTAEDGDPFPDGTHVALTHWSMGGTNGNPEGQLGVWQYCSDVSGEVVDQFMQDYPYSDSPEPGAA
jgi:hypothetical protein